MLAVLFLEILILIYYCLNRKQQKNVGNYENKIQISRYAYKENITYKDNKYYLINKIIFIVLISLASLLVFLFFHKTVYNHIDAILSWDEWALAWADNRYPRTYGDYPQLTPILMSIPYVYMGTTKIQLFSILTIEIFIIPCLWALYTLRKTPLSLPALICALGLMWLNTATKAIAPDVALTIVMILSFVFLQWYLSELDEGKNNRFYLYSAFIAAATSAFIKQTGLIWCFSFVLMALYYLKLYKLNYRAIINIIGLPALLSLVLASSWYIFNSYLVYIGLVPSKLVVVFTDPVYFKGRSFVGRAIYCFFHYSYYSIFTFPALRCLFIRRYFPIALVSLMFMGGWILFLSYGSANGKLPVLLSCFCLGYCLDEAASAGRFRGVKRKLSEIGAYFREQRLRGAIKTMASILLVVLAVSWALSDKINTGLIKSRNKEVLKIGQIGLQMRVDYLLRTNPQKLLTCDGRIRQLGSIPQGYYSYCYSSNEPITDFGYLVLNEPYLSLVREDLDKYFRLDYSELQYSLYIKKPLF
jgi:hypothetical protein